MSWQVRGPGVAVALLLALALVGCTATEPPPDTGDATSAPPSPSATDQPVTLRLHAYGDRSVLEAYRRIAEAYHAERPAVTVEVTTDADAVSAAATVAGQSEAGAAPDVFLLDQYQLPDFVAAGRLRPVDGLLEDRGVQFGDDYQRVGLTAFGVDNDLQCMPAELSPLVVFANTRLVRKARLGALGVTLPVTREDTSWPWEDFEATARAVARVDRYGPVTGVALPADLEALTAFVRSAGGDVVDSLLEPRTLTLSSDAALTAVTALTRLARDSEVALTDAELAERSALDRFAAGELGMYVGTRADVPALREVGDLSFDVLPLPSFGRSRTVARISGYCIDAASTQVDAAADLVTYLAGPDGARVLARTGSFVPSHLATLGTPAFTQPVAQPGNSAAFVTATRRSEPMPYTASWAALTDLADGVLARLYAGTDVALESTVETRLSQLDEESAALLAPAGG